MVRFFNSLWQDIDGRYGLWYGASLGLCLCVSLLALGVESYWPFAMAIGSALAIWVASWTSFGVLRLCFFLLPWSIEVELPGGFGLDFPTEIVLLYLSGICIVKLILDQNAERLFRAHCTSITIISLLIIAQLGWTAICALWAEYPMISFKFMLAKIWYILPFYVLPLLVIYNEKQWVTLTKTFLTAVVLTGLYTFVHHGIDDWAFSARTWMGKPFFRNHVNYAGTMLIAMPICGYLYRQEHKKMYLGLIPILLFFSYFSYARIVYFCIVSAIVIWIFHYLKILKPAVILLPILIIIGGAFLFQGDRLWRLAPDYKRTISHDSFDKMLEASVQWQDISALERLHRWVAGFEMIKEKPFTGFGPGNFYNCYQDYTINSFQTYVSDNPDHSGIHNYYLMLTVEQGFIGIIIFYVLIGFFYCRISSPRPTDYQLLAMFWMSIILSFMIFNDMLEVIKMGPFFWLSLMLLRQDWRSH